MFLSRIMTCPAGIFIKYRILGGFLNYEGYTTSEIVDQAFTWEDTPEGEQYWLKIYNELVENEEESD